MSELVAPYSRKHLYIVLHQYNDQDEPVLARAQVIKDSSFFPASTSTYIAAEAFRISMFGNPDSGYCYQYVKPDWFIAADVDDDEVHKTSREYDDCNITLTGLDLRKEDPDTGAEVDNWVSLTGNHQMETGESFTQTSSLGACYRALATEFNDYRVTAGSILKIEDIYDDEVFAYVRLKEKPSLHLEGPGFGPNGLGWMRGTIRTIHPESRLPAAPLIDADTNQVKAFQIEYIVEKSTLPDGMTLHEFGVYLSSGVNLYAKNGVSGPVMDVLGPHRVMSLNKQAGNPEEEKLHETLTSVDDDTHARIPWARLIANDGELFDTGPIQYVFTYANGQEWHEDGDGNQFPNDIYMAHMNMSSAGGSIHWLYQSGTKYCASLCVRPNLRNNQAEAFSLFGNYYSHFPEIILEAENPNQEFYAYTCHDKMPLHVSAKKIEVEVLEEQPDLTETTQLPKWEFTSADNETASNMSVFLCEQTKLRNRIEGRSGEDNDKGIMCVNELFEMFNVPEVVGKDGYWQLQTHSNGGFVIHLTKPMTRFQITKSFADALGLEPTLTTTRKDKMSDKPQRQDNYIFIELDEYKKVRLKDDSFESFVVEDVLSNYVEEANVFNDYQETELAKGDPVLSDLKEVVAIHKETRKKYQVINRVAQVYHTQRIYNTKVDATVKYIDGVEVYEWERPPLGSILNTARVSAESFALFSSIQVILPDLPFQSQFTSYSAGERSLLELRFPISYNGQSDGTGRVGQTSDDKIGDLLWSVSGGGHQWLPVSSIGDIYSLSAQVNLVYRNATDKPPRPVYISKGGIWQLKICLLEVK